MVLLMWLFIGFGVSRLLKELKCLPSFVKNNKTYYYFLIGVFMSLILGSLSTVYFQTFILINIIVDGMFTTGVLLTINTIIDHFDNSEIK